MRDEITEYEWTAIKPMLPNKPRGMARANDRRVLNGTFWVLRSGAPWRDLPESCRPPTACYNRFVRWQSNIWGAREAGRLSRQSGSYARAGNRPARTKRSNG